MPSSSKILKGVEVLKGKPRVIELRNTFPQLQDQDVDPAIAKQLRWLEKEAEAITRKAEAEAVEILAKAQAEGESLKAKAYEEGKQAGYQDGYQEGYREALAKGEAEIAELSQQKRAVIDEVIRIHQQIFKDNERTMIGLAFAIAEKVIKKQVELDPKVTCEIAKHILQEAQAGESYLLFVNPVNLDELLRAKEELVPFLPPGATLRVLADPEITAGGCRLETNLGFTDGTIESQLAEVKKALKLTEVPKGVNHED